MEQTPVPPILMGVYRYPRMMTSTSEPTILGVLPGRAPFTEQQLAELAASRPAVEGHPASQSLMAGRTLYVGAPGKVDGTYQGGVQSIVGREIGQQREIRAALRELLTAVGVAV